MKNRNKPQKGYKTKKAKLKPEVKNQHADVQTRYHVKQHLPRYFRMPDQDGNELEGRLDEIHGKSDK